MFASLRHKNYRYFWVGTLVSNIGDWMDNVAFNWLMWELTGSGAFLGLLALFRAAPILVFTLFGGALADRMERRRLLQLTQLSAMILALILAALVLGGWVEVWHVFAIAAGRGIMMSINMPTRQALLSDVVEQRDLTNAIALNSATMNLTRVLGGTIGGILITIIGTGGVFLVNGLSTVILILTLSLMVIPPVSSDARRRSILRSIGDGLSYIRASDILVSLILLALAPMIFGMPYMTLLPDLCRRGARHRQRRLRRARRVYRNRRHGWCAGHRWNVEHAASWVGDAAGDGRFRRHALRLQPFD